MFSNKITILTKFQWHISRIEESGNKGYSYFLKLVLVRGETHSFVYLGWEWDKTITSLHLYREFLQIYVHYKSTFISIWPKEKNVISRKNHINDYILPSSAQVGNFSWKGAELALLSLFPSSRAEPSRPPGIVSKKLNTAKLAF